MRFARLPFIIILVLAHVLAGAQQPHSASSPGRAYENGSIVDNLYTNECLGLSLAIPDGWQLNTLLVGVDARARHTTKGALSLLLLEQHKPGTFDNRIALNAHDASVYGRDVKEFVSNSARQQIETDPERRKSVKDAYSVRYGGKVFFRTDYKQTMSNGQSLYLSFVYTKFRGYFIGETLGAASPEELDLAANSLRGISFHEDHPDSGCVMLGDPPPGTGGVIGGVISSKPVAGQPAPGVPQRVRISQGLATSLLVTKVQPIYPDDARQAHIQGAVVLKAEIDTGGNVEYLSVVSGDPMLSQAAMEAVTQWKYKPYLLNNQPAKVETQVTVNFQLTPR